MTMAKLGNERGSALLTSVIVVVVLAILGVGLIRFASRESAGALAGTREQSLVACADAARQMLVSKFSALGLQPTSIAPLDAGLDTTGSGSRVRAVGGHYDSAGSVTSGTNVTITQVAYLPDSSFGPSNRVRDLTNVVAVAGQGGRPLKVVVHCQQASDGTAASGRQLEIEFGVRFGL
jgi:type II secretory pathway pseudopilin PulG